jgi:PIN domain nuclease of toxin-antitoxin system
MNVLLDTHPLLWWLKDSPRLGKKAKALIRAGETMVWVSSVCIWEISIKAALGRLDILEPFAEQLHAEMERSGFRALAVTFDHALGVRKLPRHLADPFDRMLIAQARCQDLHLMTADAAITAYDVRTIDASA